jgi:hypothetical protein
MAINTDPYTPNGFEHQRTPKRSITTTALKKLDITRQGITGWRAIVKARTSRHDPKTPAQLRIRNFMRDIRRVYDTLTQEEKDTWPIPPPLPFFRLNLARLMADEPITRTRP